MRRIESKILQARTVVALIIMVSGILLLTSARMIWSSHFPSLLTVADASNAGHLDKGDLRLLVPLACTIFTASDSGTVLFGNNKDTMKTKSYYWVVPAGAENYGGIYFGHDNFFAQGGINEKGLALDGSALRPASLNRHPELPPLPHMKLSERLLGQCATVEEALKWVKQYNWGGSWGAQIHLADATGDAAVIGPGADGELAFTRKKPGDGYLVSTNFNLANPSTGGFPCQRYEIVTRMFEQRNAAEALTVDHIRSILDATHQEGAVVNTAYSYIFDLRQGVIYLYHWYQFDEVVVLKVADELAKGAARTPIRDLFSKQTVDRAASEYAGYQRMVKLRRYGAWTWLLLTVGSVAVLIWNLRGCTRMSWGRRLVWVLVVVLLGLFGLLAYLLSKKKSVSDHISAEQGYAADARTARAADFHR
jgi:hypothetical protein